MSSPMVSRVHALAALLSVPGCTLAAEEATDDPHGGAREAASASTPAQTDRGSAFTEPPTHAVLSSAPAEAAPVVRPKSSCPPEMVEVAAKLPFCVDRWEASLERVGPAGTPTRHPFNQRPDEGVRYRALSAPGVFPQAYVSRLEASAACEEAGKRLCSMSEWQRACRRAGSHTYPDGALPQPEACNQGKPHLLPIMFPERGYRYRYDEHFNDPALSLQQGYLAKTGAYERCTSELEVHDRVGNLHEWVSDDASSALIAQLEASRRQWQPAAPGNGVFMGGFYSTRAEHGPGCTFTTVAHEPAYHDYSTGFRCCAAVTPR